MGRTCKCKRRKVDNVYIQISYNTSLEYILIKAYGFQFDSKINIISEFNVHGKRLVRDTPS